MPNTLTGLLREKGRFYGPGAPPWIGDALALAEEQEREWSNCAQHLAVSRGLLDAALKHNEILVDGQATSNAKIAESERQLAAAQASFIALRDGIDTNQMHCNPLDGMSSHRYVVDRALANGTATLAAHDERVRREALESAAKSLESDIVGWMETTENDNLKRMVAAWLRERAKGGGNG